MAFNILVVDDNPRLVSTLSELLQTLDFVDNVFKALDRKTALEIIRSYNVDAALVDYLLEGYDGLSLAYEIKQLKPDIKIAILSVVDESSRFRNSKLPWIDEWITKSMDLNPIYEFLYRFSTTKV